MSRYPHLPIYQLAIDMTHDIGFFQTQLREFLTESMEQIRCDDIKNTNNKQMAASHRKCYHCENIGIEVIHVTNAKVDETVYCGFVLFCPHCKRTTIEMVNGNVDDKYALLEETRHDTIKPCRSQHKSVRRANVRCNEIKR